MRFGIVKWYRLNKKGRSGGLWAGCARPQTPIPRFLRRYVKWLYRLLDLYKIGDEYAFG